MSWEAYYEKSKNRPLRPLYLKAVDLLQAKSPEALDLGCGMGIEVLDMLKRGFKVSAMDREPRAIDLLIKTAPSHSNLHTEVASFEEIQNWPSVDLFYACHSLPFCSLEYFDQIINKTVEIVKPGGLYVASFFGPDDEWVVDKKVVGISPEQLKLKLKDYEILEIKEVRGIHTTVLDGEKMMHTVDVIAKRKGA